MNSHSAQSKLKQYQKNMKVFVKQVEDEVQSLVNKYEAQIKQLKYENLKLKEALRASKTSNPQQFRSVSKKLSFNDSHFPNFSPIKNRQSSISKPVETTFFMTPKIFPKIMPIFGQNENSYEGELSKSRFECEKQKTRQKQQQLLQSLESGKNNLDLNTTKMLTLFGRQVVKDEQSSEQEVEERAQSQKKSSGLNTSLSSICESLDTSFHARKSREKHSKLRKEKEKKRQKKLQEAKIHEKKLKDQGLKNLLKSLRNNVNSVNQETQIIKNTRLLNTGGSNQLQNLKDKSRKSSKSKVMINPIAVDITKRAERSNNTSYSRGANNSQNPPSILKSTSKILTKSLIGNISTISQN